MHCYHCNNSHDGSFGSGKYCSKSCANSRIHSQETKTKISKSLQKCSNEQSYKLICSICEIEFFNKNKRRLTCSSVCQRQLISKNSKTTRTLNNTKLGGARINSGKSISGWYKGIYCNSTYELAFLIYHIENNISIQRCDFYLEYEFQNKIHKYYPDFIVDNKIYEIKGRIDSKALAKQEQYPNIIIIDKEKIQFYIQFVKRKFNIKNIFNLYDSSNNKTFNYSCHYCHQSFTVNDKKKTTTVYCSKQCSMKGNHRKLMVQRAGFEPA